MVPSRKLVAVLGLVVGLGLALVPVAPATAVTTIQMSGTITNTDGLPQAGTVCLELVGSGSCGDRARWSRAFSDGKADRCSDRTSDRHFFMYGVNTV